MIYCGNIFILFQKYKLLERPSTSSIIYPMAVKQLTTNLLLILLYSSTIFFIYTLGILFINVSIFFHVLLSNPLFKRSFVTQKEIYIFYLDIYNLLQMCASYSITSSFTGIYVHQPSAGLRHRRPLGYVIISPID